MKNQEEIRCNTVNQIFNTLPEELKFRAMQGIIIDLMNSIITHRIIIGVMAIIIIVLTVIIIK